MKTPKRQQSDKLKQKLTKNGYAGKFPTIKWGNAFKDYYHYGLYKKKIITIMRQRQFHAIHELRKCVQRIKDWLKQRDFFLFFIFIERLIKSNLKKLTLIWNIITTWIRGPSLAPLGTRDCITCGIYWNDWKSCFLH